MRRPLSVLILAAALFDGPAAGATLKLKAGGQPVDFALWTPSAPSFSFQDLALNPERLGELETKGSDFIYRLYRSEIHLGADGKVDERETRVRLLTSQAAVHRYGETTFWVDAHSDTTMIEEAYSLLPGGQRVEVDPAIIQVTPDDEDRIFSDTFDVTVPFAGLVPGSMTLLVIRTRHDGEAVPLPWSRLLRPQTLIPVERFEVTVTWDQGMPPPVWKSDLQELQCTQDAPRRVTCTASEVPAFEGDPDIQYADKMPSLVIAEPVTWSELARTQVRLFEKALEDDPALDRQLMQLIHGTKTPEERLARIHAFVAQEVRYLGLEHGLGGIIPRPTRLTLARRFGDCKDKTALFVDLARRAGIEAFPVLTSTNRSDPDKLLVPAAGYFNHMVACVRLPSEGEAADREICLDLTDPYSPFQVLSNSVQGAIRLDVRRDVIGPRRLPAAEFGWIMTVREEKRLTPDGALETEMTRTFAGLNAAWLRSRLQSKSPEGRREWLREDFYDTHKNEVDLLSATTEGVDELSAEIAVSTRSLYKTSFDPEKLSSFYGLDGQLRREIQAFTTENENHDYDFPGLSYRLVENYVLLPGHSFDNSGARIDFSAEFGRFTRRYEISDSGLQVITELAMPRGLIKTEAISRFNDFIQHVRDHAGTFFEVTRNDQSRDE